MCMYMHVYCTKQSAECSELSFIYSNNVWERERCEGTWNTDVVRVDKDLFKAAVLDTYVPLPFILWPNLKPDDPAIGQYVSTSSKENCSLFEIARETRACRLVMYAAHGGPGLTYKNRNASRLVTIALLPFLLRRFLEQIIIRADVCQTSVYSLTWHACLARCMRSAAFCSSDHHPKT